MFIYYLDLAWRSIKKTPYLSLLMVMAISIGIGITITTLNVYRMASINPAQERSKVLFEVQLMSQGKDGWEKISKQITYQDATNIQQSSIPVRQTAMFASGAAIQTQDPEIIASLERIRVANSDFFDLFSVPFIYGQAWDKNIDTNPKHVVVISESLNQKLFAGLNSVGKSLYIDQKPYQVVGVTKEWQPKPKYYDLNNGSFSEAEKLFVPFSLAPIEEFGSWGNNQSWKTERIENYQDKLRSESHWIQFWVELPSPEHVENYQNWLDNYVKQQKSVGRFERDDARAEISDVSQWLKSNEVVSQDNKILVALSALFLLVCLVNMLGLLLAKFLKRAPEVGVRRAIGASRGHIFSQHLVEVGLIGLFGGVTGLLWALVCLKILSAKYNFSSALTQIDGSMWLIAPSIAIIASMAAGLYPAWQICTTKPSIYLKSQ